MEKLLAARKFDQGFSTVEYVASAIIDLDLHEQARPETDVDIDAAEAEALARMGMPAEIVLRHRPHAFSAFVRGGGYAAGYYSYLWSEVMDADAFSAFQETGDVFHPETAEKLRRYIYSSGGSLDPAEAYRAFRGRMPEIDALLEKRGLKRPAARRHRRSGIGEKSGSGMDFAQFNAYHTPALEREEAKHCLILSLMARAAIEEDRPARRRNGRSASPVPAQFAPRGAASSWESLTRDQCRQLAEEVAGTHFNSVLGPDEAALWVVERAKELGSVSSKPSPSGFTRLAVRLAIRGRTAMLIP